MAPPEDIGEEVRIDERFQKLVPADRDTYGCPPLVPVRPLYEEGSCGPRCRKKVADWIAWHGAPCPADRHAEYLYVPADPPASILISAVLAVPASFEDYRQLFSSKRRSKVLGRKAANLGYTAEPFTPSAHAEGIYEIVHSTSRRQGRDVIDRYWDRPADHDFSAHDPHGCPRHDDVCMAVLSEDGGLAAYFIGKRVGEIVFYEEIMGHADHLANDVMYLLHAELVRYCIGLSEPPALLHYAAWYSGEDPFNPRGGLNRWKRKVRMRPAYLVLASS